MKPVWSRAGPSWPSHHVASAAHIAHTQVLCKLTFLTWACRVRVCPFIHALLSVFHAHCGGEGDSHKPFQPLCFSCTSFGAHWWAYYQNIISEVVLILWSCLPLKTLAWESNRPFSEPLANLRAGTPPFTMPRMPPPTVQRHSHFLPRFPSLYLLCFQGGRHWV